MDNKKIFEILIRNSLFVGADPKNITKLIEDEKTDVKNFSSGQEVDICGKMAFVISGSVCVYSQDSKRNLLLRKIEKDEIFGLAGLFVPCNQMSRCFSKGKSEILLFQKDTVRTLLEKDKNVMYNYITFLSGRINYLNKKITYLTAGTAERKLAVYLSGFDCENLTLQISYSALSDMLDIGRASLYRAFERFEADGFIKREGNSITILNKASMLEKY